MIQLDDRLTYPDPLYQRASEALLRFISEQRLEPGDRLPSEIELANGLGISRPTLREALTELASQGVVDRRRGVGTFLSEVEPLALRSGIERLASLRELSVAAGLDFTRLFWSVDEVGASEDFAAVLDLDPGVPLVRARMTAGAYGVPSASIESIIASDWIEISEVRGFGGGSLLDLILQRGRPRLHHTSTEMGAAGAAEPINRELGIPEGTPVLQLVETFFDRSGRPVMHSRNHFLTSKVAFTLVRRIN